MYSHCCGSGVSVNRTGVSPSFRTVILRYTGSRGPLAGNTMFLVSNLCGWGRVLYVSLGCEHLSDCVYVCIYQVGHEGVCVGCEGVTVGPHTQTPR